MSMLQEKLPSRPAEKEFLNDYIRLPVVSSSEPSPQSSVILIGLKNLFQRQLPKMPREYITRLVLDQKHYSMAIVKRGLRVVGGICYRPFESRGFAEIVFCAVESSEQIKVSSGVCFNHSKFTDNGHSQSGVWIVSDERGQGPRPQSTSDYPAFPDIRRQLCHRLLQEAGIHQGNHFSSRSLGRVHQRLR